MISAAVTGRNSKNNCRQIFLTTNRIWHSPTYKSIVAFLLWLYLSSCVGVFGVCFCAAQTEVRENANDHPERHPE